MTKHRLAARVDENQGEIVKDLLAVGCSVDVDHDDILVGHNGKTYWFEIKDPVTMLKKNGDWKKGALKPSQEKLLRDWRGHYEVVTTLDQILKTMGITK